MKKYFIILILLLTGVAISQQETFEDEVIIHLINYNQASVTATATRLLDQGAKWYPPVQPNPYTLIDDDEFDIVNSNNNYLGTNVNVIIYDLEGDQNYDTDKTLAVGFYRLEFSNKTASVYVNTVSKDMDDVHMTLDYANNKLYLGNCTSCTNEITNTDIFYTFDTQNTVGIEDYWANGLYAVLEENEPVKVTWSKFPTNNTISKYRIYKNIDDDLTPPSPGSFTFISDESSGKIKFLDVLDYVDIGSASHAVHYYVKCLFWNGSEYEWSENSNILTTTILYTWSQALTLGNENGHPRLVWWEYPDDDDVVCYKLYRKYGGQAWSVLYTTSGANTFSYTDNTITIDEIQSGTTVQYKVTAVYNIETESSPSNIVSTNAAGGESDKLNTGISKPITFSMSSNYPNPFNPSTTIEYSTPERSNVIIKVYDMLGREIKVLVNETKDEGTYQVMFNAESLSSGVYIYTITASNSNNILYRESKQMVLMK